LLADLLFERRIEIATSSLVLRIEDKPNGNIYIADTYHHRIRKVTDGGIITTVAGTGAAGYNGDNITPTKAKLQYPWSVHIHMLNGYKYMEIGDTNNMRVRRVWPLP